MTMSCRNKKGFTLIEMLIAMTLGLLVTGAAIGVFNYSQNSYNVQEDIAAMQQDVRVAKTLIERDLRMAGTGLKEYPLIGSMTADDLEPIMFENNQGENGSDILTIRYLPPSPDPCGEDPDTGDSVDIPCSSLPDLHPLAALPALSSEVVVAESLTVSPYSKWSGACYCDNVTYASPQAIVVITPSDTTPRVLEAAVLDEVESASDNLKIENQFANTFPVQSTIRFFSLNRTIRAFKYFLKDGVLMREDTNNDPGNPQPIAEHIEDLQLAFGLDTDDDTVIDYWGGRQQFDRYGVRRSDGRQ